mgnify:CR=1 FL=1
MIGFKHGLIDFNILNEYDESLFLYRLTPPASKKFFTPGGRILKNEPINNAIARILNDELNLSIKSASSIKFIKVNEHFYADSAFSNSVSTHYVNLLYEINRKEPIENIVLWKQINLASYSAMIFFR